jgi:hypothetical protein
VKRRLAVAAAIVGALAIPAITTAANAGPVSVCTHGSISVNGNSHTVDRCLP